MTPDEEPRDDSGAERFEDSGLLDDDLDNAVQNLLLRELGERRPPSPLSRERLVNWLCDCNYPYFVSSDDQVGGIFGGRLFTFGVLGSKESVLCVRGTWNRDLNIERIGEILEFCNNWNAVNLWPKAYARVLDNGVIQVHAEVAADLEYGATDIQLDEILECGLSTGQQFFDALDSYYPDPARLAP